MKTITCGVPQESTLGPLLFLLYINDLQYAFWKSIIHHFADDINLIFSRKELGTIESVINNELKHLVQWLRGNKLSENETKTELIIFRSLRRGSNQRENLILDLIIVNSNYILMLNI